MRVRVVLIWFRGQGSASKAAKEGKGRGFNPSSNSSAVPRVPPPPWKQCKVHGSLYHIYTCSTPSNFSSEINQTWQIRAFQRFDGALLVCDPPELTSHANCSRMRAHFLLVHPRFDSEPSRRNNKAHCPSRGFVFKGERICVY